MKQRVERALSVYAAHRWNPTTRLCGCGEVFEATLEGHAAHKAHRMQAVLEAADAVKDIVFCDQCAGPYTEDLVLMEQYGGHWDTCPNRAKAIMNPEDGFGET